VLVSEDYLKIKKTAYALLAKREHSVQELHHKLLARNDNETLVDEVMQALAQEGYLSDERYAEMVFRHRFNRGNGPKRIIYDLRQKGVSDDLIHKALREFDGDWFRLAQNVRQKRFGQWQSDHFNEKAKQMRFLAARGFEVAHIEGAFGA